ncbi:MAG: LysM peptidoglycan-binding domain-containing protein [Candidatus Kerfeldbacteria bacterium]|nr:LysM peptidoglycan-binding domain-containing protein [Candidatus Kerfeldbacteria bacterium]
MINLLTKTRKNLRAFSQWLEPAWPASSIAGVVLLWLSFIFVSFARIVLGLASFLLELPIHALLQPTQGFQMLARRGPNFQFLDSYTAHLRRYRMAVATIIVSILTLVVQTYFLGSLIFQSAQPRSALAYTSTVTISPSWDGGAHKSDKYIDDGGGGCLLDTTSYVADSPSATTLLWGLDDQVDLNAGDCTMSRFNNDYRSALKFSLSSVPVGATITKVELLTFVTTAEAGTVRFVHISGDAPDTLSASNLYDGIPTTGTYTSVSNWNTSSAKTVDLGSSAVTDAQGQIGSNYAVGINASTTTDTPGQIGSQDSSTGGNRPVLRITYTLPPQAPTNTGHASISTSSIGWTWTDNATAETRYDVKDTSNANVTGCTNLAANSTSCTETGLSANTQYTRHPNVTDADGNTDGPTASVYTSIESPADLTFSSITTTSITTASSTSLSNLSSGSSGVYFQENNTSTNSGWLTTNSWAKSGLAANTQYAFQVKARNGDAVETSLTSAQNKYTLSATPNATTTRSTSTWYTSGTFDFTNAAGWGAGGVQYYRYVWDQTSTHAFAGTESTWSSTNANCPSSTCTTANTTLSNTATADGNTWYLHVQSFNGDNTANGSGTDYGPYYFDSTNPSSVGTVTDDGAYTSSSSQLHATWGTATDATSGLLKYQYAIGTTAGGTNVVSYTDNGTTTSVTKTGLTLSDGTTYYFSVRAVDNAGNIGSVVSSDGIIVDATGPTAPSTVNDGTGADATYTTSTTQLSANWTASTDSTSGIQTYQYAIGTTSGGTDVVSYTDNGTTTAVTKTGLTLTSGTTYYFSVRAVDNAGNTGAATASNGIMVDAVPPSTPGTVNDGTGADATYTTSTTQLSANWTASTDAASGIQKYQYAIGTAAGTTDVVTYTDNGTATSVTKTGLSLTNGSTYYVSVRAVDNAGNTGSVTSSNGVTVNTSIPTITDNQTGDTTARKASGTTYDVDFAKAASGPQLDYAQYAVYSAASLGGTQLKNWTDIFTTDTDSYTTDWSVDFASLQEGTNYVSVRVYALDGLSNEVDDVFTILKDTTAPSISSFTASPGTTSATLTWTSNEAATSQIDYGVTTVYGTTTTEDTSLLTSHSVTISGLTAATEYHARANSIDQAGNVGSSSDLSFTTSATSQPEITPPPPAVIVLATPMITSLVSGQSIVDPHPLITGTGPANVGIYMIVDGRFVQTVPTDAGGAFQTRLNDALSLGGHTMSVRARDAQGNTSDPSAPITFSRVIGSIAVTVVDTQVGDRQHPTVTYRFVAPGHAIIKVFLDEKIIRQLATPIDVVAAGLVMTVTLPDHLSIGSHHLFIESFDQSGKGSVPKGFFTFTRRAAGVSTPVLQLKTPTTYVVQSGDSLWSIAHHIMGSGSKVTTLINANQARFPGMSLSHPLILPGWVLVIPPT